MTRPDGRGSRTPQGRYLYERLEEKAFQRMCGALLAHAFPDVTCMPVGQSDGGRDAVRWEPGGQYVVYQVKWSANPIRSPVAWLNTAIKGEADNIRRLVRKGATQYHLMTSVDGTSAPDRGTMDRLDERLAEYSAEFGIPMRCWWRADIDARLNSAPETLLWSYADMLAGWDLMRYLIEAPRLRQRETQLRDLVVKVVATQWDEDSKVKFKQVDLDSYALADLYVDVEAERIAIPRAVGVPRGRRDGPEELGGVVGYLLRTDLPLTLIRGAPGQGKSTLSQYLCQLHREAFLPGKASGTPIGASAFEVKKRRVPLRVDLRDYAAWLAGRDPFDVSESVTDGGRGRRHSRSIESFLVALMRVKSGDLPVAIGDVHDVIARFPLLLVLDGLDEVASSEVRSEVVSRIDELCARLGANDWPPQVVVTTRPNSSGLAEPSADRFETIALRPLELDLRRDYLDKWADSRGLSAADRGALTRIFVTRSAEPHIAQLAENPMQLTILLYLIQKRGDSIPDERTELYRSYMETFLDREAAKSPAVHRHRKDLEEVTAYLGWHFQMLAESAASNGQLSIKEIKRAILNYLHDVRKDVGLVDDLFTAVTDRVWALTSKEQGTFRFDVQPVQEYFAASHLYHVAGAELPKFDGSEVFLALVRRPYWFNTCRFYAGFAAVKELAALAEVLEEEIHRTTPVAGGPVVQGLITHTRKVTWTLLADGVFVARRSSQARVARLITDDLSVRLLVHALGVDHDLPAMAEDRGGELIMKALLQAIADRPHDPINKLRGHLLEHLVRSPQGDAGDAVARWWRSGVETAAGTEDEAAWMYYGKHVPTGIPLPEHVVSRLVLDDPRSAVAALEAGLASPEDSAQARQLLRAALDGQCSDAVPRDGLNEADDLISLFAAGRFRQKARSYLPDGIPDTGHPLYTLGNEFARRVAKRLIARDARYERAYRATHTGKGQKDTTSVWGNTARELAAIHGPCLLGAEIAVIGAALPANAVRTGGDITPGSSPLGPQADYGRLIRDIRHQRSNQRWWVDLFRSHPDALSRITWALALLAVADTAVVARSLDFVDDTVRSVTAEELRALRLASSRTGAFGVSRRLQRSILDDLAAHTVDTALLVLHHTAEVDRVDTLDRLPDEMLGSMIDLEPCSWPAVRAIGQRMIDAPSLERCDLLRSSGPLNPVGVARPSSVPEHLVQDILAAPADMPNEWLLQSELHCSEQFYESTLGDLASAENWFV